MLTILTYHKRHFEKSFLQVKQLHDTKGFNTRLPSFVIPKITVVWHMKPE